MQIRHVLPFHIYCKYNHGEELPYHQQMLVPDSGVPRAFEPRGGFKAQANFYHMHEGDGEASFF